MNTNTEHVNSNGHGNPAPAAHVAPQTAESVQSNSILTAALAGTLANVAKGDFTESVVSDDLAKLRDMGLVHLAPVSPNGPDGWTLTEQGVVRLKRYTARTNKLAQVGKAKPFATGTKGKTTVAKPTVAKGAKPISTDMVPGLTTSNLARIELVARNHLSVLDVAALAHLLRVGLDQTNIEILTVKVQAGLIKIDG